MVSGLSAFWLTISTIWASVMFVITLSVGEALYSPRVYDYTMMVRVFFFFQWHFFPPSACKMYLSMTG